MARTTNVPVNLEKLGASRLKIRAGDIFALRPRGRAYYFGRVIRTDVPFWGARVILLYIYAVSSDTLIAIPPLRRNQLLVPPLLTNRLAWRHGYFQTVRNIRLTPWDLLPVHCFKNMNQLYCDVNGQPLAQPTEPVGTYGLDSYRTIDDAVSRALGIPVAPD
jgi:hypothetical protein